MTRDEAKSVLQAVNLHRNLEAAEEYANTILKAVAILKGNE